MPANAKRAELLARKRLGSKKRVVVACVLRTIQLLVRLLGGKEKERRTSCQCGGKKIAQVGRGDHNPLKKDGVGRGTTND